MEARARHDEEILARIRAGEKQRDVARSLGLSQSRVSKVRSRAVASAGGLKQAVIALDLATAYEQARRAVAEKHAVALTFVEGLDREIRRPIQARRTQRKGGR
jgi:transcriptional regulator with XRE-family HTH domain